MNVIDLFEESCITDWVGPMEATVEQGDGAYRFDWFNSHCSTSF